MLAEAAKRAGSEDGLEAVVDASQELQLELGLIAAEGDSRALPFLERLGLKAEELRAMEPEAAFRAVVEQLQRIPNVADRATAAEEIFGGTSEKLAGIINLTNAEFAALQTEVENTSNILSGQALDDAKAFDQEMRNLKATLQADAQAFAVDMLPAMTSVLVYMNTTAVPGIKDFKTDALEPLASFIKDDVVPAFGNFKADGLVPAAAAIQGFKTDALQPLATFFLETLVGGLKAFTDELPTIEEHLVPVVESFTGLADAVAPIVEDLAPLGQALLLPSTLLGILAKETLPVLVPLLKPMVEDFGELASDSVPKLAGPLGNVVDSFQRFLETLGPLLPNLESFAKVITPSKTILELLADSIFPVLVPHIQKFAGFIADAADNALPRPERRA